MREAASATPLPSPIGSAVVGDRKREREMEKEGGDFGRHEPVDIHALAPPLSTAGDMHFFSNLSFFQRQFNFLILIYFLTSTYFLN